MLYPFLSDEHELDHFAQAVLPDVGEEECFLLMLCARRKYLTPEERERLRLGEAASLRREVVADRGQLLHKVKELCVPRGLYRDRGGEPIPEHAFAVYVTPNPRSYRKAAVEVISRLARGLAEGRTGRLDSLVKTEIHRAVSRKLFLDLDVDPGPGDSWEDAVRQARAILGATPVHVIRTRSGAHLLARTRELDRTVKKAFHQQLRQLSAAMAGMIEIRGDAMVPVPGTTQGGAVPVLLRDEPR